MKLFSLLAAVATLFVFQGAGATVSHKLIFPKCGSYLIRGLLECSARSECRVVVNSRTLSEVRLPLRASPLLDDWKNTRMELRVDVHRLSGPSWLGVLRQGERDALKPWFSKGPTERSVTLVREAACP